MKAADASWDMESAGVPSRRPWWKRALLAVAIGIPALLVLAYISLLLFFGSFKVPTASMANTILPGDWIVASRSSEPPERGQLVVFEFPGNRDQIAADQKQYYTDRVVAVAGDTLQIRNNRIYVNGVPEKGAKGLIFEDREGFDMENTRSATFPHGYGYTGADWGPLRVPRKGDVIDLASDSTRFAWDIFVRRDLFGGDPGLGRDAILSQELPATHTVRGDYYFVMGDNRDHALDSRYWGFVPVGATYGRPLMIYMSIDDDGHIRTDRMFTTFDE